MKIVICDDDSTYVKDILGHIKLFMFDNQIDANIKTYTNGNELLKNIEHFDIAFLDVEIDDTNGIEIAKRLKEKNENIIFFIITAYNKYLDDALDLNVLRFLEKPIDSKRFYSGMEKAMQQIDSSTISFFLKENNEMNKIHAKDIIYIEIVERSTKVVTTKATYYSKESIKFWDDCLVASYFQKVHSSFIINMKYISGYKRDLVVLCNEYKIPIAYRQQASFRHYFLNYFNDR